MNTSSPNSKRGFSADVTISEDVDVPKVHAYYPREVLVCAKPGSFAQGFRVKIVASTPRGYIVDRFRFGCDEIVEELDTERFLPGDPFLLDDWYIEVVDPIRANGHKAISHFLSQPNPFK